MAFHFIGRKTKLAPNIIEHFPKIINNYHEPFIGSGALLIELLHQLRRRKFQIKGSITAYDVNGTIIMCHQALKDSSLQVCNELASINSEYKTLNTYEEKCDFFKKHRCNSENTNIEHPKRAASFIFQQTFQASLGRNLGKKSSDSIQFNLPELSVIGQLYRMFNVKFIQCEFFHLTLRNFEPGDVIYMDPPYFQSSTADIERFYGKDATDPIDLIIKMFERLTNVHLFMSNSNADYVKKLFAKYQIIEFEIRYQITNSHGKSTECLMFNLVK